MANELEKAFPVNPIQIDASKHLFSAFSNMETEISAGYIIRMFQEKGNWQPFTQEEIEEFYSRSGHTDGFTFNALIDDKRERLFDGKTHTIQGGWIVRRKDGQYEVTEKFIEKAFESSPRK